ncbi:hypothetical protein Q0Z83_008010 [Actinoplanes sichuanensis]|uniref:SPW repeat-containing protein n=1 Tax=Actinoplanes sichuanensis TaxID=512349 RepID=A0ABW4AGR5_9ACTN|nr:hypothetical protein [Actinoplanes sichuanensis]BEL02610.1 hypothetical protein Q0Z83_008010 [Actinoplanes sichuanensis]
MSAKRGFIFQALATVLVAGLAVLAWLVCLGPGNTYEVSQVAAAGVALLVLLVAAELAGLRPILACAAVTLGFTAAWTRNAAGLDTTGLYAVGTTMLLIGLALATALVSAVLVGVRNRRGHPA